MKRYLAVLLVSVMIFSFTALPATSQPARYVGSHQFPSCRFRYADGHKAFSKDEVRATIHCAVTRWPVPYGLDQALCVARRESGFNWYANNPYSSASGIYQFVDGTWSGQMTGRARFVRDQEVEKSVWNARSNVLIAIKYAHTSGSWSPWGGRC